MFAIGCLPLLTVRAGLDTRAASAVSGVVPFDPGAVALDRAGTAAGPGR